ncbi:hypothetical protein DQ353_00150 [Arthrobacter sp. AQ5-05]|uniref:putative phage holin n=1 Tax=Arthrobacter sp. AQ5-05 TaxID=2184581 RepID=UPI000DCDF3FB|nr:hypothetical protein [Arthrobacter sp. AQ5-05]RAX50849.1 hypothetical protein DQ353_00150 [Arthrobacter sp. AQ5-05]
MKAIYLGYIAASVYACLPFINWAVNPDWHKSSTGRAMMMLLASTAAAFLMIATSGMFGAYPGREVVRYIVYGAVLVAGVRLAVLFFQLKIGPHGD